MSAFASSLWIALARLGWAHLATRPGRTLLTLIGVGLGVALCRRLARELGGRLEVASANGEGAEVTLLLPTE